MERDGPAPIPGHAALRWELDAPVEVALVVADLHLGLGFTGTQGLAPAEAAARAMADELLELAASQGARLLFVAGDVKHPIVGASAPVRRLVFDFFSTLLREGLRTTVIPGNHDIGLAPLLPREVELSAPSGLRRGSVGIFHGHRWPTRRVLAARTLLCGHLHPGFRLAAGSSHEGGKHRVWVRTELAPARPRRGVAHPLRAHDVIVLPAFNPLAGIEALNRQAPARHRSFLVHRFLARGSSRAYLLDGTDLGVIPGWEAPPARPRPTPAR
jgi:hypothetical protein